MTCLFKLLQINLVPLQRPSGGSRFLSNITGTSGFKISLWGERPLGDKEFQNLHIESDCLDSKPDQN